MSVHRHAWLFEPATWTAAVRFWDKGEIEREGHGASIVRHAAATWQIEGTMEIAGDPQRVSEWLGESVEAPLEDVKVEWVAPNGTPGIIAAQVQTPNGLVRI